VLTAVASPQLTRSLLMSPTPFECGSRWTGSGHAGLSKQHGAARADSVVASGVHRTSSDPPNASRPALEPYQRVVLESLFASTGLLKPILCGQGRVRFRSWANLGRREAPKRAQYDRTCGQRLSPTGG